LALTRTPENSTRLKALGIEPWVGDVMRPETLAELPAAETLLYAVGFDRDGEYTREQVYVEGLNNVLAVTADRIDHLIYVSSTSVYEQDQGEWVDESTNCRPTRPNGRICLAAESIVWKHFPPNPAKTSPRANVLRLSGLYGPGRLLARVEQLRSGETLSGNPEAFLNLIHVDDAARAVLACTDRGKPGATYLISDDLPLTRRQYYETLARLAGAPPPRFAEAGQAEYGPSGLNKRCRSRLMRMELGVPLRYPTISSGLPQSLGMSR
jgi:nucleoside-diphosphate-sugar epimerase